MESVYRLLPNNEAAQWEAEVLTGKGEWSIVDTGAAMPPRATGKRGNWLSESGSTPTRRRMATPCYWETRQMTLCREARPLKSLAVKAGLFSFLRSACESAGRHSNDVGAFTPKLDGTCFAAARIYGAAIWLSCCCSASRCAAALAEDSFSLFSVASTFSAAFRH